MSRAAPEKNSVEAWNWWQFQPASSSTPSLGNHCAMKKKLPIAPVRAKVRGTCAVHATSICTVAPGSMGSSSGTDITVSSSALSSSGATKRLNAVRSRLPTLIDATSIRAHSSGPRDASAAAPPPEPSPRSRMNVDRVFFHAFQ
jgi:hypothetical protein